MEVLAANLGVPEFYAPNLDDSTNIALNCCDAGGAHPSSASKFLHHILPTAILQKYNAFQSSNVYPMDGRPLHSTKASVALILLAWILLRTVVLDAKAYRAFIRLSSHAIQLHTRH